MAKHKFDTKFGSEVTFEGDPSAEIHFILDTKEDDGQVRIVTAEDLEKLRHAIQLTPFADFTDKEFTEVVMTMNYLNRFDGEIRDRLFYHDAVAKASADGGLNFTEEEIQYVVSALYPALKAAGRTNGVQAIIAAAGEMKARV